MRVETSTEVPPSFVVFACASDPSEALRLDDTRLLPERVASLDVWGESFDEAVASDTEWLVEAQGERVSFERVWSAPELAQPLWLCSFGSWRSEAAALQVVHLPWPPLAGASRSVSWSLRPRGGVRGRWVGADGRGLESVEAAVGERDLSDIGDGYFALRSLEAGRHAISAWTHSGEAQCTRWEVPFEVRDEAITELGELTVPEEELVRSLRAVDEDGEAARADFELHFADGETIPLRSDYEGRARLAGSMSALVRIEANACDFPSLRAELEVAPDGPFELRLVLHPDPTVRVYPDIYLVDARRELVPDTVLFFARVPGAAQWRFWDVQMYGCDGGWRSAEQTEVGALEVLAWSPCRDAWHRSIQDIGAPPHEDGDFSLALDRPCGAITADVRRKLHGSLAEECLRVWIQPEGAQLVSAQTVEWRGDWSCHGERSTSSSSACEERIEIAGIPAGIDLELCLYDGEGLLAKRAFRVKPRETTELGDIVVELRE